MSVYPGSTSSGGLLPDLTRLDPSMGKLRRGSSCKEMSTRRTLLFRSSGFVAFAPASDCFPLIPLSQIGGCCQGGERSSRLLYHKSFFRRSSSSSGTGCFFLLLDQKNPA